MRAHSLLLAAAMAVVCSIVMPANAAVLSDVDRHVAAGRALLVSAPLRALEEAEEARSIA